MLLALAARKTKYDALDLENYMPNSLGKKVRSSSPLTNNPGKATTSKSIRLMVVKWKMKPFMEVAQNPRKLNIKVMLTKMSC